MRIIYDTKNNQLLAVRGSLWSYDRNYPLPGDHVQMIWTTGPLRGQRYVDMEGDIHLAQSLMQAGDIVPDRRRVRL